MIEHPIELPKADHSKHADQQPEQDLETGERDDKRDGPERDGADESQNEDGARRNGRRPGLLKGHGHALASFPRNEPGASEDEPLIRHDALFPAFLLS